MSIELASSRSPRRPLAGIAAGILLSLAASPADAQDLQANRELTRLVEGIPSSVSVGICVRRTTNGALLFEWAADSPFPLGGAAGLLIGNAAEEILAGLDSMTVSLAADGSLGADGTLHGNLVVRAPSSAVAERLRPVSHEEIARGWAGLLVAKGVKRVEGDVVVVDPAPPRAGGPVRAQLLLVRPGAAAGAPTSIELRPAGAAAAIQNESVTATGVPKGISFDRGTGGAMRVRGSIARDGAPVVQIFQGAAPALRYAEALVRWLPSTGASLRGTVRLEPATGATSVTFAEERPELRATIAAAIHGKDAEAVDGLLRILGMVASPATAASPDAADDRAAGIAALAKHAGKYSEPAAAQLLAGGPEMRLSPGALSDLLSVVASRNATLRASLPRPGAGPMFGNRLLSTAPYGKLTGVAGAAGDGNALAGYFETANDGYTVVIQAAGSVPDRLVDDVTLQLVRSLAIVDGSYQDPARRPPPPPGGRAKNRR